MLSGFYITLILGEDEAASNQGERKGADQFLPGAEDEVKGGQDSYQREGGVKICFRKMDIMLDKVIKIKDLQPSWLENNYLPEGWKSKMSGYNGRCLGSWGRATKS